MTYTVLDIETTGFNRETCEILEVGYIRINEQCEVLGSNTLYFYKPEFEIETSAQEIHGLKREFLETHEKDFYRNMATLYTLVSGGNIIGKNNRKFDIPFILSFIRRHAEYLMSPTIENIIDMEEKYTPIYQQWYLRTYQSTTRKKGTLSQLVEMNGHNIGELQKKFCTMYPDAVRTNTHSALFDSFMTLQLLKDILRMK